MRGEIPESANQRAMNSTIGVFPFPPHVKFPTLITGTGSLQCTKQNIKNLKQHKALIEQMAKWVFRFTFKEDNSLVDYFEKQEKEHFTSKKKREKN